MLGASLIVTRLLAVAAGAPGSNGKIGALVGIVAGRAPDLAGVRPGQQLVVLLVVPDEPAARRYGVGVAAHVTLTASLGRTVGQDVAAARRLGVGRAGAMARLAGDAREGPGPDDAGQIPPGARPESTPSYDTDHNRRAWSRPDGSRPIVRSAGCTDLRPAARGWDRWT